MHNKYAVFDDRAMYSLHQGCSGMINPQTPAGFKQYWIFHAASFHRKDACEICLSNNPGFPMTHTIDANVASFGTQIRPPKSRSHCLYSYMTVISPCSR